MPDHILFIIDGLPGGGAEKVTLTLAESMAVRGYQVTLYSLGARLDYPVPSGIDYRTDIYNRRGPLRKLREIAHRAKSLDHKLRLLFAEKGRPSLVISSLHKTDRIVVKTRCLQDCNVWHWIHGMFSHSYLHNKTGLSRWIKKRQMQRVYHQRNVITVSDAVRQDLIQQLHIQATQINTLYNPFDICAIRQLATENNPWRGEDYLLHIGRFHRVKRHDRLLEAFAKSQLPCQLIIIGQGDTAIKQEITEKIDELGLTGRVTLAGFYKNPLPVLQGARALILSSDSEGLPGVVIEALICNTPVVSTRCPGGITEIMQGPLANALSEMNADDLARKITQIYYYPPAIGEEMYAKFEKQFILDAWLALVKE
ncbi:glycosyltransferase [Enterobacteriaceae bacterium LUAb1]